MKLNKYRDNDVVLGDKRNTREIWFKVIVFLCFFVLFLRLLYLQVLQGNEFSYLAERNQYKLIKIDSPRGKILDSKGKLVVTNGTGYRLIYSLGREENEEYIKEIAKLTDKTEEVVRKRIKYGEIFPYTKDNVLFEDLEDLPRGTRLSLTGLFLYVITLFVVSYGIVFIPTIVATLCVGCLILLGMVCFFY